ncbi:MAG: HK97 family phage prohead protease [Alphaproteobacteria bacterium]|nr:HK97 family phage prohead protease [Alphaproteobacteria bacterium]
MSGLLIDADGRFSGYASLFGKPDQGGDIVMPGAFAKSLERRGRNAVRMLFQHDPKEPVGLWERIGETARGLHVEGRLLPGVRRAGELRALIASGALDGLSIGFRTERASRTAGGMRRLWQIDLWEISIVTFPMMDGARIASAARAAKTARSQRGAECALVF